MPILSPGARARARARALVAVVYMFTAPYHLVNLYYRGTRRSTWPSPGIPSRPLVP